MLESLATMSAPKIIETQESFERMLGSLLDQAAARHAELDEAEGAWKLRDALTVLGPTKFDGAEMALGVVLQCELQLDARMDAAQRVNEQDDPALD